MKRDSWSWTGLAMFSGRLYWTLETSLQDLSITDWLVREHRCLVFPNPAVSLSLTNPGYFRKVIQVLSTQTVTFPSVGSFFLASVKTPRTSFQSYYANKFCWAVYQIWWYNSPDSHSIMSIALHQSSISSSLDSEILYDKIMTTNQRENSVLA